MVKPQTPFNEALRIKELESYYILDTLPEKEYDDITLLASEICQTLISLISLIDKDRQWFKSNRGLKTSETSRDWAFCAHAINDTTRPLEIQDARLDERFFDNPLVLEDPNIVFYTGVPLVTELGHALGNLCVIDHEPKKLNEKQLSALKALSNQVMAQLELRKHKYLLESNKRDLELKNEELENFARIVAHDIKSPLKNIMGLSQLLLKNYTSKLEAETIEIISLLDDSASKVISLVNGILEHSRSEKILQESIENLTTTELFTETINLIGSQHLYKFIYPNTPQKIFANKIALQQILINLFTNSIKYNDKENIIIEVGFRETQNYYYFSIQDNGRGIDNEHLESIFKIFETKAAKDRFGNKGNGIGLSTVKKLIEGMNGTIKVSSEIGKGTLFEFTIEK